jgi:hypothetical protein
MLLHSELHIEVGCCYTARWDVVTQRGGMLIHTVEVHHIVGARAVALLPYDLGGL